MHIISIGLGCGLCQFELCEWRRNYSPSHPRTASSISDQLHQLSPSRFNRSQILQCPCNQKKNMSLDLHIHLIQMYHHHVDKSTWDVTNPLDWLNGLLSVSQCPVSLLFSSLVLKGPIEKLYKLATPHSH